MLIGFLAPLSDPEGIERLAARGVVAFAMESIPRTTRAQAMDALSSQSTVAGYKATLLAADRLPRLFPLLMTAAGTVAPAKVLVLGAGVAGLQAIATARRLGAVVSGFDVRPAVREQVESLGATFLDLGVTGAETEGGYAAELSPEQQARQQAALEERIPEMDVVITTALIPGRPAPRLIPAAAVERMRPGSVIVDLAAEAGGNCELTEPGEEVERGGVTIVGFTDLASQMPYHASQLYARNVTALLLHLAPEGELALDFDDEITAGACVTGREVDGVTDSSFLLELTILVLAIFLGFEVISKVPTLLHTPLMSGTNAIHGIVIVGAILVAGRPDADTLTQVVGFFAVVLGTANAVGGFVVTDRMLEMFKRKPSDGSPVSENLTEFLYLVTIVTFILALRFLSSPKRARLGNQVGAAGMALAIVVTLAQDLENYKWIALAMAIGAVIGVVGARRVKMTAMPQMVALFNGVGGGAVALIALAEFHNLAPAAGRLDLNLSLAMIVSAIIGSISFAGSLIAFAKLQELIGGRPIVYPGQKPVNALVIAAALGLAAVILVGPGVAVAARRRDRRRADLRRPLRAPDRRRRHAGRDLAPERLHRARGLRGRLRPARERPDRQRRARRRVRHAADAADGPRDEPVDHERPLRRVRADPDRHRSGARRRPHAPARRRRTTSRSCSRTRAG